MSTLYNWRNGIDLNELNNVKKALDNGELVIFPTETVYGIGANAFDEDAASKIYKAKGRPSDNPLIVHVSDKHMLMDCVKNVSRIEEKLINAFMPGPFTLILEKNICIPDEVTANLNTVAIRMPSNEIANCIIKEFGKPIAAPSANVSGRPSGTRIDDIRAELGDRVFALIDGGDTEIGLESTVVKVINGIPTILRPGAVTAEDIEKVIGKVCIDRHVLNEVGKEETVESPGMKHKHYSPKTRCVLIDVKDEEKRVETINSLIKDDVCVIGFNRHKEKIKTNNFINMGDSLEEISKNVFSSLRKADELNCKLILIEGVEPEGLGLAIMNRLIRTCSYNTIK